MIKSPDDGKCFEIYPSESVPGPVKFHFGRDVLFLNFLYHRPIT